MSIDNNIDFKDHIVQYPNRFKQTTISPGVVELIPTWIDAPEQIIQAGTPVDEELFEKLKQNITIYQQTFTTTNNQTVINLARHFLVGQSRVSLTIGGVKQYSGQDYTETSTNQLTMTIPLKGGLKAEAIIFTASQAIAEDLYDQVMAAISATQSANIAASQALTAKETAYTVQLTPVANFAAIATTYPSAVNGSEVQTLDDGKIYRKENGTWVYRKELSPGPLPTILSELDLRLKINDFKNRFNNVRTKNPLPNATSFRDTFANRLDGTADGQGNYRLISGTSAQFVNSTLEVTAQYTNTRGFLLYEGMNEGVFRVKVNASSNPVWLINFRHDLAVNNRYTIWRNAGAIEFGWCLNATITQKTTVPVPSGDYYIEVLTPLLKVGAMFEIRAWSVGSARPSNPSGTYTIATGDPIIYGENITLQSIAPSANTVSKISEIYASRGIDVVNKLLGQAYYSGRWANMIVNGKNVMTTINQGAEIYAELEGTSALTLNFEIISDTNPYVVISINGGAYTRYEVTGAIALTGLPTGRNIIRIVASGIREGDAVWNEGKGLCFSGFTVGVGGSIKPYVPSLKPIMYIGDSITAGVNVLGTGASALNNSGEKAYSHVSANLLKALPIQVGFGGTGVVVAGSGGVPRALIYTDRMMNDKLEKAEFPAAIVINHGTNDRYQTATTFTSNYGLVIDRLKAKYPSVPIFCVVPFPLKSFAAEIQTLSTEKGCFFVDTRTWSVTTTDGVHPDAAGHLVAATKLVEEIEKQLGKIYFQ